MNNLPGTFSLRNHFSSFPLFRPRSRSQAPPEVPYFFRRNHFSSCRPAEPVRVEAARKSGSQGDRRTLFEGTTFPRSFRLRSVAPQRQQIGSPGITARFLEGTTFPPSFRARDWRSRKQGHWADRGPPQFFRGNHFPSFRWVHGRPVGRNLLSSSSFSSSSLQGGSGIPAVPKTGASVLRLLPPTS